MIRNPFDDEIRRADATYTEYTVAAPIYTKHLDSVQFEIQGRMQSVTVVIRAYPDDVPFDGDHPEDIAAYEAGDFHMVVLEVKAIYSHLEAADILGGVCYSSEQDLLNVVAGHSMVRNALSELDKAAAETLQALRA